MRFHNTMTRMLPLRPNAWRCGLEAFATSKKIKPFGDFKRDFTILRQECYDRAAEGPLFHGMYQTGPDQIYTVVFYRMEQTNGAGLNQVGSSKLVSY